MKNRFKKLSILALSTVCLFASSQINAMEEFESKQMSELTQSLALRLSGLFTEEQLNQLLSKKDDELLSSMLASSGLGESFAVSSNIWSAEEQLEKIFINKEGEKLFPSAAPLKIFHMINDVLLPKYLGAYHTGFGKKTKFDLPEDEKKEVKKFLAIHGENIHLVSDPNLLLTFLMLLEPLPQFDNNMPSHMMPHPQGIQASQVCPWLPGHYGYGYAAQNTFLFLQYCSGVEKGQFVTDFEKFYNQLSSTINGSGNLYQPSLEQLESKKKVRQEIMEALNKILTIGGSQLFNIETDGKVLDFKIPEWFTILRQLAHFELREWKRKAPLMEQFIFHFNAAEAALSEQDGKFYSGLSTAPYTVSLIRTVEKNAVERKDLQQFLEEERKTNKSKIKEFEVVKPHLSTLEKTVKWLDNTFKFVSKQGRIS